jgi:DNA repair protein SbcC/Rad50
MRLHELEVTAFGPFAETVTVDFDQLSEAGLFLLSGATGAGKTSVLDAVCFALYGEVPGERNTAKRLRADQAAPGVAPRVTLEVTLSGRRFRIVRSPAWERPKKRGTGTTTQQASVTISERVGGAWQPLSTRLDETGHLVSHLVGMNVTQFTQVAMLPQGRFQAFLRARSDERHRLLQQLFRTGRFEDVERWLRDRRLVLRRTSDAAHQRVADLVSRASEATDARLPEDWDAHALAGPASSGELLAWATGLHDAAGETRRTADAVAEAAAAQEQAARAALDAARELAERRTRARTALAEEARLQTAAVDHRRNRLRLDAARRAGAVAPVHRLATSAEAAHRRADAAASAAAGRAADELGLLLLDEETLGRAVDDAVEAAARVRAALPREQLAARLATEVAATAERRRAVGCRLAELLSEHEAAPGCIAGLRTRVDAARTAQAGVTDRSSRLAELQATLEAGARVLALTTELEAAVLALDEAAGTVRQRREEWLDLREARLDGMAAEIAGALAVGACCPVCGSAEHPHKATASDGAPDASAEKAALKLLDDAKATEHVHDQLVRDLTTRLAVAREHAGHEPREHLAARVGEARAELTRLRAVADGLARLELDLAAAERTRDRLAEAVSAAELEAATLDVELRAREAELAAARAEVQAVLAGTGASCLGELLEAQLARVRTGRRACEALDELGAARTSLDEATRALEAAVAEAGFDAVEDAVGALLDADELTALDRAVTEHDRRLAAVAAALGEPGARELASVPAPDLAAAQATHASALAELGDARSRATLWATRVQRLAALGAELAATLEEWRPVRESLDLVTRLAGFVEGKSADNRLQMRLSAYVLAYRLTQVVAAANERLARMSDQRYSLEHTGRRGAGETRGGLSLLVRDDWSGESRDPATLSGGETFVVSLALALGLADVITQEAGGADLDTLFVDEGFGSLDADTLDDVMDTLDSLRDGGRVVGVVSHVAEMRDRIPTQLRVTKSRRGSAIGLVRRPDSP